MIEVAALLPVFVMEGLSGAFFKPLALSYALAIGASTVVALTVTPAMSLYSPAQRAAEPPRVAARAMAASRLRRAVDANRQDEPRAAYATVGVIALAGVLIWPQLGQSLLPSISRSGTS